MEYKDFVKYLKQNLPDDKTLAYLAKIEREHGKEAVLGMVTGNPVNTVIPEPVNAFELLYDFPDRVYTCNNDLQYNKDLGTSSLIFPNGTSTYLHTITSYIVDPLDEQDYFVFCVHINRDINHPDIAYNLTIGLPDYVPQGGNYDYLVFNQLPSSNFYIPNHESDGHGGTKTIQYGVTFARFSRTAFTYEDNAKHVPSSPVEMQQYSDSYLLLFGKRNSNWNYTVYASNFRLWYDENDNPNSRLMCTYDPFILSGIDATYFLPSINQVNITSTVVGNTFNYNVIQWNWLNEAAKPFLLTADIENYLTNIDITI